MLVQMHPKATLKMGYNVFFQLSDVTRQLRLLFFVFCFFGIFQWKRKGSN
jgi:nicotinamide riboside transporter PnuC